MNKPAPPAQRRRLAEGQDVVVEPGQRPLDRRVHEHAREPFRGREERRQALLAVGLAHDRAVVRVPPAALLDVVQHSTPERLLRDGHDVAREDVHGEAEPK